MTHILVAEDSSRIASFVVKGLMSHGFDATHVSDGADCLSLLRAGQFDLLILDIGLPTKDGFQVLEEIRGQGNAIPVIVLTARDSVDDRVAGLEGGADDYMSKPFSFDELLARVKLRLRQPSASSENGGPASSSILEVGGIQLDLYGRTVTVNSKPIDLTAREFTLLEVFMRHPSQVLSREQLLSRVWGYDYDPGSNVVDVYIRYLRNKIGGDAIQTVRGMGYKLVTGGR
jgi:DNA-binding response OmpR family regulator